MALTLSEEFRMSAGGRAWRMIKLTHDESTSTFTAGSVDLDIIEHIMVGKTYLASDAANTSTLALHETWSITGGGATAQCALPPKTGSTIRLTLIGW